MPVVVAGLLHRMPRLCDKPHGTHTVLPPSSHPRSHLPTRPPRFLRSVSTSRHCVAHIMDSISSRSALSVSRCFQPDA